MTDKAMTNFEKTSDRAERAFTNSITGMLTVWIFVLLLYFGWGIHNTHIFVAAGYWSASVFLSIAYYMTRLWLAWRKVQP